MIRQKHRLCKFLIMMAILSSPSLCFAEAYSVAKGDKLKISIFQWPQYSGESRVDDSGTISLPIMGIRRLPVTGLGLAQIERKILERLSTLTEMRNVVVFVDVRCDSVQQRRIERVKAFLASEHTSFGFSGIRSQRLDRNIDGRLDTAAQGTAQVIQQRAFSFLPDVFRNVVANAIDDVRGENFRR